MLTICRSCSHRYLRSNFGDGVGTAEDCCHFAEVLGDRCFPFIAKVITVTFDQVMRSGFWDFFGKNVLSPPTNYETTMGADLKSFGTEGDAFSRERFTSWD